MESVCRRRRVVLLSSLVRRARSESGKRFSKALKALRIAMARSTARTFGTPGLSFSAADLSATSAISLHHQSPSVSSNDPMCHHLTQFETGFHTAASRKLLGQCEHRLGKGGSLGAHIRDRKS